MTQLPCNSLLAPIALYLHVHAAVPRLPLRKTSLLGVWAVEGACVGVQDARPGTKCVSRATRCVACTGTA